MYIPRSSEIKCFCGLPASDKARPCLAKPAHTGQISPYWWNFARMVEPAGAPLGHGGMVSARWHGGYRDASRGPGHASRSSADFADGPLGEAGGAA
ncbi:hypothetical protein OF83DRAFT_238050 [Amylostereum chailletii]|nr:hypothetical protein OF83DRAFT_238050 [Amylostereum chailletii]